MVDGTIVGNTVGKRLGIIVGSTDGPWDGY